MGVRSGALAGVLVALLVAAAPASAEEFHVTSAANEGLGSLRQLTAEAEPGDTVVIDPGVNPNLSSPEIVIEQSLTIRGQGAASTTITMTGQSRVFKIGGSGIAVVIEGSTITGGHAPNGEPGAPEGGGGSTPPTAGESGYSGGAILNAADQLSLVGVELTGNAAGSGGEGGSAIGLFAGAPGGEGGDGGAVANTGTMTIIRSTIDENEAGTGGSGGAAFTLPPGSPGAGGEGGAIVSSGSLTIVESTIRDNRAGAGAGGAFTISGISPAGAAGGSGGAIASTGQLVVERSTFAGNAAGSGGKGGASTTFGSTGGQGGAGGAISLAGGSAGLTNVTLVANKAGDGGDGGGGTTIGGSGGAGGNGGGLALAASAAAKIAGSTIAADDAGAGGAGGEGTPTSGSAGLGGSGGGLFDSGALAVNASILASNGGTIANCAGAIADAGGNVAFPEGGCIGFTVADPKLDPAGLADNGGPTQTVALLAGSAAIDAVPSGSCTDAEGAPLTKDQRGAVRPQGATCDSGAFEAAPSPPPPPPPPPLPETRLGRVKHKIRTAKKRAVVKIRFTAAVSGATFECKLDKKPFRPCKSPKTYRLKPGRHQIKVRAVVAGVPDPTPARVTIRVIRKKAGR